MKNLFSRLGSTSAPKKQGSSDADVQKLLSQAQTCLAKLRGAKEEDFPLLNESTRLVQSLDASVSKMPESDIRTVWRDQLSELQKDLKDATEKMLSPNKSSPPPSTDSGANMFEGLSLDSPGAPQAAEATGNIFSGLNLGGPSALPTPPQIASLPAASEPLNGDTLKGIPSNPLPEDLFSSLDNLTVSSAPASDPFLAAGSDPIASSPQKQASQLQRAAEPDQPNEPAQALPPRSAPSGGGNAQRKKKITRRVGVGRDREPSDQNPSLDALPAGISRTPKSNSSSVEHSPRHAANGQAQPQSISAIPSLSPADHLDVRASTPSPTVVPLAAADLLEESDLPSSNASHPSAAESRPTPAPAGPEAAVCKSAQRSDPPTSSGEDHSFVSTAGADLATVAKQEQAAKQRRRQLQADIAKLLDELRRLQAAEAEAAEAEDFDQAASLSTQSDELQTRLAGLQHDVKAADQAIQSLVSQRCSASKKQASELRQAAAAASRQSSEHIAGSKAAASEASQLAEEVQRLQASASDRTEELATRIAARQRWLAEEQAAVDRKIQEATQPVAAQQAQHAADLEALQASVAALRAALAEKEAALAAAQSALDATEGEVRALASKFDKSTKRLGQDRQQLALDESELEEERHKAEAEEAALEASREAATARAQSLREQASAAQADAAELMRQAAALEAQSAAEQQAGALQEDLWRQHEAAVASLENVHTVLEKARLAARDAVARHAALIASAVAADEAAATARRRLPEVDADKKAAAAARDFKEAAKLSAEAKALASTAQASEEEARGLRAQAAAVEAEEHVCLQGAKQKEAEAAEAERAAALAKWRLLKAMMVATTQQLEAASAADAFSEAEALQTEVDEIAREAADLARAHHFTGADLGDSLAAAAMSSPDSMQPGAAAENGRGAPPVSLTGHTQSDAEAGLSANAPPDADGLPHPEQQLAASTTPQWPSYSQQPLINDLPAEDEASTAREETSGSARVAGASPQLLPSRAAGLAGDSQPGLRDANVPEGFPRLELRNDTAPEAAGDAPSSTVDAVSTVDQSCSAPPFPSPGSRVSVSVPQGDITNSLTHPPDRSTPQQDLAPLVDTEDGDAAVGLLHGDELLAFLARPADGDAAAGLPEASVSWEGQHAGHQAATSQWLAGHEEEEAQHEQTLTEPAAGGMADDMFAGLSYG